MQLLIIIFKSAAVKDFLLSKLSSCSGVRIIPFGVKSSLKCAGIIPWNPQLLYEPIYNLYYLPLQQYISWLNLMTLF